VLKPVYHDPAYGTANLAQGVRELEAGLAEGVEVHDEQEGVCLPLMELYGLSLRTWPRIHCHALRIIDGAFFGTLSHLPPYQIASLIPAPRIRRIQASQGSSVQ
jgi:hypothetical protein